MKFKVDNMPYYPSECLFCELEDGQLKCQIDGQECVYFKGKERDPFKCNYLIDDETEAKLKNQGGI